jgi:hypothetical protein
MTAKRVLTHVISIAGEARAIVDDRLCVKCRHHFVRSHYDNTGVQIDEDYCHIQAFEPVRGGTGDPRCDFFRHNERYCGLEGRFWEPKT